MILKVGSKEEPTELKHVHVALPQWSPNADSIVYEDESGWKLISVSLRDHARKEIGAYSCAVPEW